MTQVEYDMRGFLRQCLEKYESLVDHPVKFKTVSTPFHDDKIAPPIGDEAERRGELQAIASRVLNEGVIRRPYGAIRLASSDSGPCQPCH